MTLLSSEQKYLSKLVSFWKHHPIADQRAETLAKKTLEFQKKINCDFIKFSPSGTWQAVCYGVTDAWNGDSLGRRVIVKTIINSPSDWLLLPDFSKNQPAMLKEIIKACALVYKETPNNIPILATVFCPISQAIQLAGLSIFLQHTKTHPKEVLAGLEQITQNTMFIINKLVKSGANGVFFVTQHMENTMLTPEIYKAFGEFFDTLCLNACQNLLFNIFHIHGKDIFLSINDIPFNCFLHFENAPEINVLNTLRSNYPHRVLVGIPIKEMQQYQTEEEMEELVKKVLCGDMITASCVLPLGFSDEKIINWVQFSKKRFQ